MLCTCTCTGVFPCMQIPHTEVHTHACTLTHAHTRTHTHTHTHAHARTPTHTCTSVHTCRHTLSLLDALYLPTVNYTCTCMYYVMYMYMIYMYVLTHAAMMYTIQYASKKNSHKRAVQRVPVLIKQGENGSARSIARSNGRVYRVVNVEDQRRCWVFSGLGVLKQA